MNRSIANALGIALIALCGLAAWGGFGLTRHLIVAVDLWGNAASDLKPTLDAISGPRGTLHEANKALVKIGDAIVTTQLQERAIAPHTVAAMDTLNQTASKLGTTAETLSETAHAASGSLNTLTDTLGEGKRTLQATEPLLEAYTRSGNDLDAFINENRAPFHGILVHSQNMSVSADGMLADAQWKTHQLLHPDKVKLGLWGATWAAIKAVHEIEPPIF